MIGCLVGISSPSASVGGRQQKCKVKKWKMGTNFLIECHRVFKFLNANAADLLSTYQGGHISALFGIIILQTESVNCSFSIGTVIYLRVDFILGIFTILISLHRHPNRKIGTKEGYSEVRRTNVKCIKVHPQIIAQKQL